jgi:hypothetical protein
VEQRNKLDTTISTFVRYDEKEPKILMVAKNQQNQLFVVRQISTAAFLKYALKLSTFLLFIGWPT